MSRSWKWPSVLTACACAAGIAYFELEPRTIIWFGLRNFFKFAIVAVCLQAVLRKIYEKFTQRESHIHVEDDLRHEEIYNERTNEIREEIQTEHNQKAASYKERILIPREEAKRKKKEDEFLQFTGPAWKGKGDKLGGEDERSGERSEANAGGEARDIRKLPESVLLHVPQTEPKKTKRVIKLPDEPDIDADGVMTIVLRTPLGTNHKRRFPSSCTLQVVFDYMTTLGFKEKLYTLATSYPRQQLTDQVDQTLCDLDIHMQVLNIEEV